MLEESESGLCCPSRASKIRLLNYLERTEPRGDGSADPYGGSVYMQDSKLSLGVSATFQPNLVFSSPNSIVQMYMLAYLQSECNQTNYCVLSDFFQPGTSEPKEGNVFALLNSNVMPTTQISALKDYPIGTMENSLGYQIHIVFVDQGTSWLSANGATQEETNQNMYNQLYNRNPSNPFNFYSTFPARESFD